MTSRPAAPESETPRWVCVHTVDEMEEFYKAILPQIRTEAKYHGYAIGLHGSMRRDLDLIAIPWSDDHSDKDELARAIQEAACGMPQMVYQWNSKPCGRVSVSIPVCRPEWPEELGDGHIDLSVMPDLAIALSLAQTEIKGHMRIEDDLKAEIERERMRVVGCSVAALGNWKEGDSLHADYDCVAIRDVAKLRVKYDKAQARIAELEKNLALYYSQPGVKWAAAWASCERDRKDLEAHVAALGKDAARYRHIRKRAYVAGNGWMFGGHYKPIAEYAYNLKGANAIADCDAAIDAALKDRA